MSDAETISHTKGPLSLKVFGDGAFILTEGSDTDDPNNMVLASRNEAPEGRAEESRANAVLFQHAGELLYQLKEARDDLCVLPEAHDRIAAIDELVGRIEANATKPSGE